MNFSHPVDKSIIFIIKELVSVNPIVIGGGDGFGNVAGNSKYTEGGMDVDPDIRKQ